MSSVTVPDAKGLPAPPPRPSPRFRKVDELDLPPPPALYPALPVEGNRLLSSETAFSLA